MADTPLPSCPSTRMYQGNSSRTFTTAFASTKRKREDESYKSDNVLVSLCRSGNWIEACSRYSSHPYEAVPVPIESEIVRKHRVRRNAETNVSSSENEEKLVYHPTVLGIACASDKIGTYAAKRIILGVVAKFSSQISCSQVLAGHTPLRDAVLNPRCTREILGILMEADRSGGKSTKFAAFQRDSNGLFPIDHLVMKVQASDCQGQSSSDFLKTFIETKPPSTKRTHDYTSPLVRLLTIGNSSDTQISFDPLPPTKPLISVEKARMIRILDVSKYLLDNDSRLLYECSRVTGCSPLHVALRNYGDCLPLIREISGRDKSNRLMSLTNKHGDLPIHVASSTGVSSDTLYFVVSRTIEAMQNMKGNEMNPLLLTKNYFGYTPLDLEWLNYIESGTGALSARSYYPFQSARGNRFFKEDSYYENLLREAVDRVISEPGLSQASSQDKADEAEKVFGVLLERIAFMISAASSKIMSPDPNGSLLHHACKLCTRQGPGLPLPLLQLILWMHEDKLLIPDRNGNLPMHYALGPSLSSNELNAQQWEEWNTFCLDLLSSAPKSSKVVDQNSRLPIHLLLDYQTDGSISEARPGRQELVEKFVECFPESVDIRDPLSKLDPFMLSATRNANLPLSTVFFFLRQSPLLCCSRATSSCKNSAK